MLRFIIHDTANDIAVIETSFGFHVRYGLQVGERTHSLAQAMREYFDCLRHALAADLERAA